MLKAAFKNQGALSVVRYSAEAEKDVEEVIHTLVGKELFNETSSLEKEFKDIQCFFFHHLYDRESDYDALLMKLLDDPASLQKIAGEYRQNYSNISKLEEKIKNAFEFFSSENLSGLKKYGRDARSDVPFSIILSPDKISIQITGGNAVELQLGARIQVRKIELPQLVESKAH